MSEKIAVVLAAGKGTRMDSDLPKVLVPVCGRPMVEYVLDALHQGGIDRTIVVIGYRAGLVRKSLGGRPGIEFALQTEQLGTGHAVQCCLALLEGHDGPVLVVTGDSPLMQADSIRALLAEYDRQPAACILGTLDKDDPTGLGRILRNAQGDFIGIVEEKDASDEERRITEVNMSYYVFENYHLRGALRFIRADNAQGEYYLTDCPGVMINQGLSVRALLVLKPCEALAVNTAEELAAVEAAMSGEAKP